MKNRNIPPDVTELADMIKKALADARAVVMKAARTYEEDKDEYREIRANCPQFTPRIMERALNGELSDEEVLNLMIPPNKDN